MSVSGVNRAADTHHRPQVINWFQLALNLVILGGWGWLYWPLTTYLRTIFIREEFRTNQILLIAVVGLIVAHLRHVRPWPRPDAAPRLAWWPLILALGGSVAYLLAERFLNVNTLSVSLFGLATYGLLGLWLSPPRWRGGIPAALLLIGTLPFGDHMQTFIGYPMRIGTAALIRDGLTAVGITSIGIDTILVFENGVSQIDVPCSGVKSLWTGAMFFIAATWIERRAIHWRWLGTAVLFALTLFVVNLIRILILVIVGEVWGWHLMAQMLHVPLGVLGFILACGLALWGLRRLPFQDTSPPEAPSTPRPAPVWLTPLLIAAPLLMAWVYTPRPQPDLTQLTPTWTFPVALTAQLLPFQPGEYEWITQDGADAASRYRFTWEGISGSMILITSHTWRAHHRPERCFEVDGLVLDNTRTHLVGTTLPVRFVSLRQGERPLSATYWFQSAHHTTDDYGTRIWSDLALQREEWVLVSILFDDVYQPDNTHLTALYQALHQTVADHLNPIGVSDESKITKID